MTGRHERAIVWASDRVTTSEGKIMETVAKHRGVRHHTPGIAGLCLLIAASLLIVACGSSSNKSSGAAATAGSASWSLPGGDLQNTRPVGGPINASNASTLGVARTVPLTATGTFGAC